MTYEGRSPEDLTELAMRIALLGESNPLGSMSFLATAANPLTGITTLRLSEDSFEQIALLLITEELVGRLSVDHISHFRLGPPHRGLRRLRLGWMPVRRYQNQDPVDARDWGRYAGNSAGIDPNNRVPVSRTECMLSSVVHRLPPLVD